MRKLSVVLAILSHQIFAQSRYNSDIHLNWGVTENNYQNQFRFLSSFTLLNNGSVPLAKNWEIYFNYVRNVVHGSYPPNVKIEHVNGDLFRLKPTNGFEPLKTGDSLVIPFVSSDWATNYCDAPAGPYIVFDNKTVQLIKNYQVKPFISNAQIKRFSGDNSIIPTAESNYKQYSSLASLPSNQIPKILPTPKLYKEGQGTFLLSSSTKIFFEKGLEVESKLLAEYLEPFLGKISWTNEANTQSANFIRLATGKVAGSESYKFNIGKNGIEIVGQDAAGVAFAIQSIRSLIPLKNYQIKSKKIALPFVEVEDAPRFAYRGMHLDVARNFQNKESVLRILDLLAFYKLNKFHFHITDDEGWRIEIPGLPELTQIGSKRGHNFSDSECLLPSFGSGPFTDEPGFYGSGYYTRQDFIEILQYATKRHIEVILEVDVPGHARAAIKSMDARYARLKKEGKHLEAQQYLLRDLDDNSSYLSVQMWKDNVICPCQPSTFAFYEKVIGELVSMYKEANAPIRFFHLGGDEVPKGVWERSAACQKLLAEDPNRSGTEELYSYFMGKMDDILKKYNLRTAGWEEIGLVKVKDEAGNVSHQPDRSHIAERFVAYTWNNVWGWGDEDNAYKLANAGYDVVLGNVTNLYFDLAYNKDPREPGYYWGGYADVDKPFAFIPEDFFNSAKEDRMGNPIDKKTFQNKVRLKPENTQHILGIQGQLWSENAKGRNTMEYLIFPKMLALAERAWSESPAWASEDDEKRAEKIYQSDWNRFVNQLGQRELPRLDFLLGGVHYRIPTPGGIREKGIVKANMPYPGFTLRYTIDGTEPTSKSPVYSGAVQTDQLVKLRAFDSRGRGSFVAEVK